MNKILLTREWMEDTIPGISGEIQRMISDSLKLNFDPGRTDVPIEGFQEIICMGDK